MLRSIRRRRAQTVIEYAVLIAVVVAALLAMRIFFKRSLEGKIKESGDRIGKQFSPVGYGYTFAGDSTSTTTDSTDRGGSQTTNITASTSHDEKHETFEGITAETERGLYNENRLAP